eukprot:Rmarinus@m.15036
MGPTLWLVSGPAVSRCLTRNLSSGLGKCWTTTACLQQEWALLMMVECFPWAQTRHTRFLRLLLRACLLSFYLCWLSSLLCWRPSCAALTRTPLFSHVSKNRPQFRFRTF